MLLHFDVNKRQHATDNNTKHMLKKKYTSNAPLDKCNNRTDATQHPSLSHRRFRTRTRLSPTKK